MKCELTNEQWHIICSAQHSFENAYELLIIGALDIQTSYQPIYCNVSIRYIMWSYRQYHNQFQKHGASFTWHFYLQNIVLILPTAFFSWYVPSVTNPWNAYVNKNTERHIAHTFVSWLNWKKIVLHMQCSFYYYNAFRSYTLWILHKHTKTKPFIILGFHQRSFNGNWYIRSFKVKLYHISLPISPTVPICK